MSKGCIFIVRTPLREAGGMTYGGPMRIKIGRRRVAYAGFMSESVAAYACRYWNLPAEHFIEPWQDALHHEAPGARARQVLLFRDEEDFRCWLRSPDTFDVDAHTVSLHFAVLDMGHKRSA